MNQLKFYKYATGILLIFNLAMLSFFFITKPKGPIRHGDVKERAKDFLKLDEEQHAAFLTSANKHKASMNQIDEEQSELLKGYFNSLVVSSETIDKAAVLEKVKTLEGQKIASTYEHFEEIKTILKPEQQPNFEQFMKDILSFRLMVKKKNAPPPKDF